MERRGAREKNINRLKYNILIALLAVVIAICSRIAIPSVVPFTLQSLAIYVSLMLLGGKRGIFCVLLYLALGLIGIPVSASGQAGIAMLTSVTGGYLIGWIFCALTVWLFEAIWGGERKIRLIAISVGTVVCYAVGAAWFVLFYSRANGTIGVWSALCTCVLPFIAVDALKLFVADRLALVLKRATKI